MTIEIVYSKFMNFLYYFQKKLSRRDYKNPSRAAAMDISDLYQRPKRIKKIRNRLDTRPDLIWLGFDLKSVNRDLFIAWICITKR